MLSLDCSFNLKDFADRDTKTTKAGRLLILDLVAQLD